MSGNINVGLEGRSCTRRMIKPPGGGHTQLFGFSEDDAPRQQRHAQTEISGCFTQEVVAKKTEQIISTTTVDNLTAEVEYKTNGNTCASQNGGGVTKDAPQEVKNGGEAQMPASQPQKRVPPGGFSSGFW